MNRFISTAFILLSMISSAHALSQNSSKCNHRQLKSSPDQGLYSLILDLYESGHPGASFSVPSADGRPEMANYSSDNLYIECVVENSVPVCVSTKK